LVEFFRSGINQIRHRLYGTPEKYCNPNWFGQLWLWKISGNGFVSLRPDSTGVVSALCADFEPFAFAARHSAASARRRQARHYRESRRFWIFAGLTLRANEPSFSFIRGAYRLVVAAVYDHRQRAEAESSTFRVAEPKTRGT
jgi:hypothetical protein